MRVAAPRASNEAVAEPLDAMADLLHAQHGNPYRERAYREAARALRAREGAIADVLEREGRTGLEALPGIGPSLAAAIDEIVHTGRLRMLERLEGSVSPEDLFTTVPGIGEALARRLHAELGVDTLEDLELAAHDGRLAALRGFGPRRVRAMQNELAAILSRSTRRRARARRASELARGEVASAPDPARPSVATLLALDEEYRCLAAEQRLRLIAPRRFNPRHEAWLPVMHAERDGFHFTLLFSNTARAHELGKTHDWVVVYFERDGHEDQHTVVTETSGEHAGRRVVRGREAESAAP